MNLQDKNMVLMPKSGPFGKKFGEFGIHLYVSIMPT